MQLDSSPSNCSSCFAWQLSAPFGLQRPISCFWSNQIAALMWFLIFSSAGYSNPRPVGLFSDQRDIFELLFLFRRRSIWSLNTQFCYLVQTVLTLFFSIVILIDMIVEYRFLFYFRPTFILRLRAVSLFRGPLGYFNTFLKKTLIFYSIPVFLVERFRF